MPTLTLSSAKSRINGSAGGIGIRHHHQHQQLKSRWVTRVNSVLNISILSSSYVMPHATRLVKCENYVNKTLSLVKNIYIYTAHCMINVFFESGVKLYSFSLHI